MIDIKERDKLADLLKQEFDREILNKKYKKYVTSFYNKHINLCIEEGMDYNLYGNSKSGFYNKRIFCELIASLFCSEKIFKAFFKTLPKDVQFVMEKLLWDNEITADDFELNYNLSIYKSRRGGDRKTRLLTLIKLKPEFYIFVTDPIVLHGIKKCGMVDFSLPDYIKKLILPFFDPPKEKNFIPLGEDDLSQTDYVFKGEKDVWFELTRLMAYDSQGQINQTKNGYVQAGTLGKMQRKLSIKEFYPESKDRQLKLLRSRLLAGLIIRQGKIFQGLEKGELLKRLFYKVYQNDCHSFQLFFPYFKGKSPDIYRDRYFFRNIEPKCLDLITRFPINTWLDISDIIKYVKYNFIDLLPVSVNFISYSLYFNYKNPQNPRQFLKEYIKKGNYNKYIELPYLKATMFLFAAYGLLDIAYDKLTSEDFMVQHNSPYDGLRYVRLNNLGAYILGKTPEYELPETVTNQTIRLSEDSLTILIEEEDLTAPVILEPFAYRVSPNRYRTDFYFFLTDIIDKQSLDEKISLFKHYIKNKGELPEVWNRFFKELYQKFDPLAEVEDVKVFKLPALDKALHQLIVKDSVLRELCHRGENYQIIIAKKDLLRFKKRLLEFGYLMIN